MKSIFTIFLALFSFYAISDNHGSNRESNNYKYTSIGLHAIESEKSGFALNFSVDLPGSFYAVLERQADGIDYKSESYDKVIDSARLGLHMGVGDIFESISSNNFEIKIKNNFDRITLVNFHTKERVTIDFNLTFSAGNLNKELENICIIEVKREKGNRKSEILSILKLKRIRPTRFSKYTIGSCILNPNLKYNNFKRKLLFINKISKNGIIWN